MTTTGVATRASTGESSTTAQCVDPHERRTGWIALIAVAAAFTVAQVVVLPIARPFNWDEVVYISQLTPGEPAAFMHPHRTRGMSLLVAPAALLDASPLVTRIWMTFLAAAGLVGAFAPWVRLVGKVAALAAGLLVSFWVSSFYGAEVYPNFPVALALVAAIGLVANFAVTGRARLLWLAGACLAAAALIRHVDAVVAGAGLGVAVLLTLPRHTVAVGSRLLAGGLLGLAPWWIEGWIRFGATPIELVTRSQSASTGGRFAIQLPLYMDHLEGPLRCINECRADFLAAPQWLWPPPRTAIVLLFVAVFLARGLLPVGRVQGARTWSLILLPALALTAFYSLSGSAANLRYLIPVWALLALPVADGMLEPVRRARTSSTRSAILLTGGALLVAVATWQTSLAADTLAEHVVSRERARILGELLTQRADGEPCAAAVQYSFPQIQYWSSCLTAPMAHRAPGRLQPPRGSPPRHHDLRQLALDGYQIFALSRDAPRDSPARTWDVEPVEADLVDDYQLYVRRDDQPLPPAPGSSLTDEP